MIWASPVHRSYSYSWYMLPASWYETYVHSTHWHM